ncbi:unnamed protein product [marine sediment metagenome]|uniref:Uncharacterized protein n=1 Tax=marine sediment metagenome TaxID=412755 RepID=X0Z7Q1_9ZZZZ
MYAIEECEICEHGTRFPQGMYCFELGRYISESEAYPNPCRKFSTLTSRSSRAAEACPEYHKAARKQGWFRCSYCGKELPPPA